VRTCHQRRARSRNDGWTSVAINRVRCESERRSPSAP
jgi:hypothetical protein